MGEVLGDERGDDSWVRTDWMRAVGPVRAQVNCRPRGAICQEMGPSTSKAEHSIWSCLPYG